MNRSELVRYIEEQKRVVLLDGSMGTLLAENGWNPPSLPEEMNIHRAEVVVGIHSSYRKAGAKIIETNTFGGNPLKLETRGLGEKARDINALAARLAKSAAGRDVLVAGSIGPLGELLSPFGILSFDKAYHAFRVQAEGLVEGGADFLLIETMIDLREAKAAVLAVKDTAPETAFVVSFTFDRLGHTVTGTPPDVAARWSAFIGAAGVGANCGVGPEAYVSTVEALSAHGGIPVFAYGNAGIPGNGDYHSPEVFAAWGRRLAEAGASVVGGCCGTTPKHISALAGAVDGISTKKFVPEKGTPLASRSRLTLAGPGHPFLVIGERINVSRASPLRDEIARSEWSTLREEAFLQTKAGASVLDVNVGLPTIDQEAVMEAAIAAAEQSSNLPLSIDSDSRSVLESGLSAVTGIPLINSFTGREDSLFHGLALAKRHGAAAVVLPIDEDGLSGKIEKRISVIRKIISAAEFLGFPREGLVIDGLTLAVGADSAAPATTLATLSFLRDERITSILGVSNISHGMPARSLLNRSFLAMAIAAGLSSAIMNPLDSFMMETLAASELLAGRDPQGSRFIAAASRFTATSSPAPATVPGEMGKREDGVGLPKNFYRPIVDAILHGDGHLAKGLAKNHFAAGVTPIDVVNCGVIPALEEVEQLYDRGEYFLPQLISSAGAAQGVCEITMDLITASRGMSRGKILMATVEGDFHDLGKNVVGAILKSHGYSVTDLGKNVPCEAVIEEAERGRYEVVGLSTLMTSTMKTMASTVAEIRRRLPEVFVLVGGASLNDEFAHAIGAHGFAPDAVHSVRLLESLLGAKRK